MGKRGQITTFVILGIILFAVLAVIFFSFLQKGQITQLEKGKVNELVLGCMEESLQRASDYAATQLSQVVKADPLLGKNLEQLKQFLKENIEYDLKENQNVRLLSCLNEKAVELQSVKVTSAAQIDPTVTVQELEPIIIEFDMTLPITLTKGDSQENLERFTTVYEVR